MLTLYGIRNCDTVKRARAWLDEHGVAHHFHDYKVMGVEADRLGTWVERLGWEAVLNRAGTTFRKLPDADKADLDGGRAASLMLALPSTIRRPIVEVDGELIAGFSVDRYHGSFCATAG